MQVEFHVLDEPSEAARLRAACRLVEAAYTARQPVLAWCADAAQLQALDELLWTFRDGAFVPHEACDGQATGPDEAPVRLYCGAPCPAAGGDAVLLNLRETAVPADCGAGRLIEVIDGDPARRTAGRERFKAYRERGLAPAHHKFDNV
ncbi:MAG: hypothetical protein RL026_194 [Pseudomonadota bacterium]|jgi:DNA polymerase-3 subunit chi